EHQTRQKRGGGLVRGESALVGPGGEEGGGFAEVVGGGRTPASAAAAAEECQRLLEALPDEDLRQGAPGQLEGHTHEELSQRRGWSVAKVERKLKRIRHLWDRLVAEEA